MKKLLLILAILLLASSAFADVYYVSKTGSDSGTGSQFSPFLTLTKAESVISDGDTVYVSAGTYIEAATLEVTYDSEWIASGSVTIKVASGDDVLKPKGTSGTGSFTGFTFDATGSLRCVYLTSSIAKKTFNNCTFTGASGTLGAILNGSDCVLDIEDCTFSGNNSRMEIYNYGDLTLNGCTVNTSLQFLYNVNASKYTEISNTTINSSGETTYSIFFLKSLGTMTVSECTINVTGATYNVFGIDAAATGTLVISDNVFNLTTVSERAFNLNGGSLTLTIDDNDINITDSTTDVLGIIYCASQPTITISDNTITSVAVANTTPIYINSSSVVATVKVTDNIISHKNISGYGIRVGVENSDANDGNLNDAIISGNTLYGPLYHDITASGVATHGILFGYSNDCKIYRNKLYGEKYGIVVKGGTHAGGEIALNLITLSDYNIMSRGTDGLKVINNTIILDLDSSSQGVCLIDDATPTHTSNCVIKNNIIYDDGSTTQSLIEIDADNNVGLSSDYNSVFGNGNIALVDGTAYTTLADWQTASSGDANSIDSDPLLNSVYTLQSTSPCIGTGVYVSGVTDGHGSISYFIPSIGAYEARTKLFFDNDAVGATVKNGTQDHPYGALSEYAFTGTNALAGGIIRIKKADTAYPALDLSGLTDTGEIAVEVERGAHLTGFVTNGDGYMAGIGRCSSGLRLGLGL